MGTIRFNKSDLTIEGATRVEDPDELVKMGWVDTPEIGISTGHETDQLPNAKRLVLDRGLIRRASQAQIDGYKSNRKADHLAVNKRNSKQRIEDRMIDMGIIRATQKRLKALEQWANGGPKPAVISGAQFKQSIKDEIDQA